MACTCAGIEKMNFKLFQHWTAHRTVISFNIKKNLFHMYYIFILMYLDYMYYIKV